MKSPFKRKKNPEQPEVRLDNEEDPDRSTISVATNQPRVSIRKSIGLGKLRTIQVPGNGGKYVTLSGWGTSTKRLVATAKCFEDVKILERILKLLRYSDLNSIYYTCTGLQCAILESDDLSRVLFLEPDFDRCLQFLPVTFLSNAWRPWTHDDLQRILGISHESFERLRKEPRLEILDRLIAQPPFRYMDLEVALDFGVRSQRKDKFVVHNPDGITVGDVVSELDKLHVRLEHEGQKARVRCQELTAVLVRCRFITRIADNSEDDNSQSEGVSRGPPEFVSRTTSESERSRNRFNSTSSI